MGSHTFQVSQEFRKVCGGRREIVSGPHLWPYSIPHLICFFKTSGVGARLYPPFHGSTTHAYIRVARRGYPLFDIEFRIGALFTAVALIPSLPVQRLADEGMIWHHFPHFPFRIALHSIGVTTATGGFNLDAAECPSPALHPATPSSHEWALDSFCHNSTEWQKGWLYRGYKTSGLYPP